MKSSIMPIIFYDLLQVLRKEIEPLCVVYCIEIGKLTDVPFNNFTRRSDGFSLVKIYSNINSLFQNHLLRVVCNYLGNFIFYNLSTYMYISAYRQYCFLFLQSIIYGSFNLPVENVTKWRFLSLIINRIYCVVCFYSTLCMFMNRWFVHRQVRVKINNRNIKKIDFLFSAIGERDKNYKFRKHKIDN